MLALVGSDRELGTQTIAHAILGWDQGDVVRQYAAVMTDCVDADELPVILDQRARFDSRPYLQAISMPTLVVFRRDVTYMQPDTAAHLAGAIPGAQMALLTGSSLAPYLGDVDSVKSTLAGFLGEELSQPAGAPTPFRTVLFTDVVGHTEMMRRLGDERGREVLREHERITREVLKANGGTEVKTMGDGFMASFGSVVKGVECAIALQKAFDQRNTPRPASPEVSKERSDYGRAEQPEPLHIRVGLNAGEPIEDEGDLFGSTVILAARIAGAAEGGQILASNVVRELCSGKSFLFADRGEHAMKGFEDPVRVYEVN
jgi:class 3 adenylate cyclase